jgi:CheY-like chemotaxis protein
MGLRILVIEDEMTIALLIEDMLGELGHEVVGMAMRLPQAMEMAQTAKIDLAILDVNLDGRMSFAVADLLEARRIPFIFATGYGAAGLAQPYNHRPLIKKPFEIRELEGAIRATTSR